MSFFTNPWKVLSDTWDNVENWWKSTTIGKEIDTAASSAKTELEALAPEVLSAVVSATTAAMLPSISAGAAVNDILSAGVAAAVSAFKAQGKTVLDTTLSTLVSSLHSSAADQLATHAPAAN